MCPNTGYLPNILITSHNIEALHTLCLGTYFGRFEYSYAAARRAHRFRGSNMASLAIYLQLGATAKTPYEWVVSLGLYRDPYSNATRLYVMSIDHDSHVGLNLTRISGT